MAFFRPTILFVSSLKAKTVSQIVISCSGALWTETQVVMRSKVSTLLICFGFLVCVGESGAADDFAGDLITFNENGAWSWFEGEQATIDSAHSKILVSSVANTHGADGMRRGGDIDVVSYDLASHTTQRFTLNNKLQENDHDSAALLILPDGRYLASYSKHASDNCLRYRTSLRPGDASAWQPEETFLTAAGTTYSNLFYLSKTNTIFDFYRDRGHGFDPNYLLTITQALPQLIPMTPTTCLFLRRSTRGPKQFLLTTRFSAVRRLMGAHIGAGRL